jgi:hypothetical protein
LYLVKSDAAAEETVAADTTVVAVDSVAVDTVAVAVDSAAVEALLLLSNFKFIKIKAIHAKMAFLFLI